MAEISKSGAISSSPIWPSKGKPAGASSPDFIDTLKAKFDSATRNLQSVEIPGAPGPVYTYNNNIYNTLDISHGGGTSNIA